MNFTELKAEVVARGFDYLPDTRVGQYVNWAYGELIDAELWPFRYLSQTGTANGGVISSVTRPGPIILVHDVSVSPYRVLEYLDDSELDRGRDRNQTGTPTNWFTYRVGETLTIQAWPAGGTIEIYYYATAAELTGTDTPIVPTRYHDVLVDMAVQRAYRDADNHEAATAVQADIERRVDMMRNALLIEHVDGPQDFIQERAGWGY